MCNITFYNFYNQHLILFSHLLGFNFKKSIVHSFLTKQQLHTNLLQYSWHSNSAVFSFTLKTKKNTANYL